jgi:uncharacterized protein YdeI (YjbR/CyaY-like superfamily)
MNAANPKVDGYIRKSEEWQEELQKLRAIILDRGLIEEVKWRVPCYTYQKKIVLFIGRLKESCVLSFAKGTLLKDAKRILIQQTENSQSVRIIRFTSIQEIVKLEPVLKAYINQAIEVEKAGLKVKFKKTSEFNIPEEFQAQLDEISELKTAFAALTPGRQRGYLLYFSGAKQSKTRAARVEKYMQQILAGKGIDDE